VAQAAGSTRRSWREAWAVSHSRPYGVHLAEQRTAADAFQRPLRFRFQARLTAGVRLLLSRKHAAGLSQKWRGVAHDASKS
jgi:uncharacterized protein YfiM (DUF2279 family)